MARKKNRYSVSRSITHVRASSDIDFQDRVRHLTMAQLAREREKSRARLSTILHGIGSSSRNALNIPGETEGHPADDAEWHDIPMADTFGDGADDDAESEVDDVIYDMRDILSGQSKYRHSRDHRSWKLRRDTLHQNWAPHMDNMISAYLSWRNGTVPLSSGEGEDNYDFNINVVDVYNLASSANIPRSACSASTAVALVSAGYMGSSPVSPSLAISLKTLELFRVIRLYRPSFSVEAFAKVTCYLYSRPFHRHYRAALSDTFDIYLAIRRAVDKRVSAYLGWDAPNYRVLNACPPCNYELENEPDMCFRRMWVMDANSSLKRIKGCEGREVADTRTFSESDYFLSAEYVDRYADEVKPRPKNIENEVVTPSEDDNDADSAGDPTDGDPTPSTCTSNWKAASSDEKKKMWGIFAESGIFASACRHGFILWLADMIRSGELAKYPLAVVSKALDVLGPRQLVGYDIGCTFKTTIETSSLGHDFAMQNCRCCVNAFHGYTHHYLCQLQNHPNSIEGMGLEDLETMERIFSMSNSLASTTRYMTAYRRRVFIDIYFQQWDRDKYENLATMLHQNYLQAIKIIDTNTLDVDHVLELRQLTFSNLDDFIEDERRYFKTLGKEPQEDLHAIAYVELLQELWALEETYNDTASRFRTHTPHDYQFTSPELAYARGLSETRRADTARRLINERRERVMMEVLQIEQSMNIETRWSSTSPEYQTTAKYIKNQKYQRALDNLHRLVIQRLFELHKLNLSQTGYRMRTHIAKSLQTRSKAIRNAVKLYNDLAAPLNRPTLDWTKVTHYSFLDEFNLLRDTRSDVREKPWADPMIRETMRKYQRLQRAKEEIQRCNIEIRRLHTSIIDETQVFTDVRLSLSEGGASELRSEIMDFIQRREATNAKLLWQINQTHSLIGYTGARTPGIRKGTTPTLNRPSPVTSGQSQEETEEFEDDNELDDAALGDIGGLVDFVSDIV